MHIIAFNLDSPSEVLENHNLRRESGSLFLQLGMSTHLLLASLALQVNLINHLYHYWSAFTNITPRRLTERTTKHPCDYHSTTTHNHNEDAPSSLSLKHKMRKTLLKFTIINLLASQPFSF